LYLQKARRVIRQSLRSSDQEFGSQAPGSIDSDPWHFLGYPEFGRIISSYRPKPYPGRVILLRTRYLEESYPTDRTAGWGRLARNLEIQELPGDHHNCLTEHLGDVAEHLRRYLVGYSQTTDVELAENSRR
jgi:thioesterase domain-containing protein